MIIRRFRKSDAGQIARLFHDTVREINSNDYTDRQVRAWAPEDIHFCDWAKACSEKITFVAVDKDTVAGFVELEAGGHIDCFYCHKNYQRMGVGSRLYRSLEQKANELNLTRLYTEASITARPFFLSRGFTVIKEQTVETRGVPLNNFRMEKVLN